MKGWKLILLYSFCALLSVVGTRTFLNNNESCLKYKASNGLRTIESGGCQYLKGYQVLTHKGDCTNPIHNYR